MVGHIVPLVLLATVLEISAQDTLTSTTTPTALQDDDPGEVECIYSTWSAWSSCSKSCGGGRQTRSSYVMYQAQGCEQQKTEELYGCNPNTCPCQASEWTSWTACSATCGGTRTRYREVTAGAEGCPPSQETDPCGEVSCQPECTVSEWSAWSACSVTCGTGQSTRTRTAVPNTPIQGPGQDSCPEVTVETRACEGQASLCEPACVVGEWTTWSACSATCGTGSKTRTREVTPGGPTPVGCPPSVQQDSCFEGFCPGQDIPTCPEAPWSINVFVAENIGTPTNPYLSDFEGSSAVGGSAWFKAFSLNVDKFGQEPHQVDVSLYVGGTLYYEGGLIANGDVEVGGDVRLGAGATIQGNLRSGGNLLDIPIPGLETYAAVEGNADLQGFRHPDVTVTGTIREGVSYTPSMDFGARINYFRTLSRDLNYGPPKSYEVVSGELILHAQSGHNNFRIPASVISTLWRISIDGPTDAEVVLNVLAPTVVVNALQWFYDGVRAESTILNLPNAHTFTLTGGNHKVTVLAPFADTTYSTGLVTGTLVAKSLVGGGQVNFPQGLNQIRCVPGCQWQEWGACSVTCGPGTQTKQPVLASACTNAPASEYSRPCYNDPCPLPTPAVPVDCSWSEWSAWSACSVTCGSGSMSRSRAVSTPASNSGTPCQGLPIDSQGCTMASCVVPVDCVWGEWSAWTACSVSCGPGTTTRSRTIAIPTSNGGQLCDGPPVATLPCNLGSCDPVRPSPSPVYPTPSPVYSTPSPFYPSPSPVYPSPSPADSPQSEVCPCKDFGIALNSVNVFASGDIGSFADPRGADFEGSGLVGGNAYFQAFSINNMGRQTEGPTALHVKGNLEWNGGECYYGGIQVGGNANLNSVGVQGNVVTGGRLNAVGSTIQGTQQQLMGPNSFPLDVAAITQYYKCLSTTLGRGVGSEASLEDNYGALVVTLHPGRNYLNMPAHVLNGAWQITIQGGPDSSLVLNIPDVAPTIDGCIWRYSGIPLGMVIVNFPNARQVRVTGSHKATFLMPFAILEFPHGLIVGNVMVESILGGNGQINDEYKNLVPFDCNWQCECEAFDEPCRPCTIGVHEACVDPKSPSECADCGGFYTDQCRPSGCYCPAVTTPTDPGTGTGGSGGDPGQDLPGCRPCNPEDPGCTHPGVASQAWCDAVCVGGSYTSPCGPSHCQCTATQPVQSQSPVYSSIESPDPGQDLPVQSLNPTPQPSPSTAGQHCLARPGQTQEYCNLRCIDGLYHANMCSPTDCDCPLGVIPQCKACSSGVCQYTATDSWCRSNCFAELYYGGPCTPEVCECPAGSAGVVVKGIFDGNPLMELRDFINHLKTITGGTSYELLSIIKREGVGGTLKHARNLLQAGLDGTLLESPQRHLLQVDEDRTTEVTLELFPNLTAITPQEWLAILAGMQSQIQANKTVPPRETILIELATLPVPAYPVPGSAGGAGSSSEDPVTSSTMAAWLIPVIIGIVVVIALLGVIAGLVYYNGKRSRGQPLNMIVNDASMPAPGSPIHSNTPMVHGYGQTTPLPRGHAGAVKAVPLPPAVYGSIVPTTSQSPLLAEVP